MTDASTRLSAALAARYRIERELGAGGMATVYLAEDLKHDRKVALKVLKPELAAVLGAERFVVEIKTTASLQHPHILPLFDSGTADGFLFYVMPFIEGETLRDKLNRETQLGVDEAVRIAREVADALDYAHGKGVIHRDIKPENILIQNGRPMVADFGIALAVSAAAGGRMTETGLSLGTPHYMSPEQATADKQITARSDVYSLASVLYEMLTGEPPHTGGSAQAIIMKIITERAQPVTELRGSVPPNVAAALANALEKLPADRFESARAFADALGDPGYSNPLATGGVRVGGSARGISPRLFWATVVVAVLAMAAAVGGWFGRTQPPAPVTRFAITPSGEEGVTAIQADRELAISPDGSRVVYVGNSGAGMFMRSMDGLDVVSLVKEPTRGPFFSPDGQWVGLFGTAGGIFKVAVSGGPSVRIAELGGQRRGGTWGEDGTIVFATSDSMSGLWSVSAEGGAPQQLTTPDRTRGEGDHVFPQFLPGARAVLFTILPATGGIEGASIAALNLKSGTYTVVVRGGSDARYAPSGHLVYGAAGTLRAVRFDPQRLEAIGSPATVQTSVATRGGGAAQFDVARNGTLIYVPTSSDSAPMAPRTLVWVDRQGRESPIRAPARAYIVPRISPDGGRVALEARDQDRDIWVWDLAAETLGRVTFSAGADVSPVWTPEGRSLVFRSAASRGVQRQAADGSGVPERLAEVVLEPTSITPDGKTIIGSSADGGGSVWALTPGQNGVREPLEMGRGVWQNGEVSPDGRWLAYAGAATGLFQIYIRPFLGEGRWQVTTEGGSKPAWSRDGKELFYLDPSGAMMRVTVDAGATWKAGAPSKLFDGRYFVGANGRTYDVSPDGRRFLMIKPTASEVTAQSATAEASAARSAEHGIVVVQHWAEELKRLVPKK